jgi:rhodanese-related sulfurtransferase
MDSPVKTISRDELRSKLNKREKFTLIETLAKAAYDHAHIPTAKNLAPDEIKTLAPMLLPDKDAEIVVYCANHT